jgi:outer membrane murein-binding lipoprotein Lpp
MVDKIGVKIAGYEIEGILSPKMVETMREAETIKSDINDLEYKVNTLSMKLRSVQDTVKLVSEYKASSDCSYSELQKEVSIMRLQLAAMNNLSSKVNQLESEVTRLTTNTALIKRKIKRQPTDDIHILPYKDGSEHRFRVYKSKAGLVKPRVVKRDPMSGNEYIDETEPLD